MINRLVVDLIETSSEAIKDAAPSGIEDIRRLPRPLIGFSSGLKAANHELKRFLRKTLYRHYRVQRMASKAKRVIAELFHAFMQECALLPKEYRDLALKQEILQGESGRARVVADYIAGMTDRYAIYEYERLFDPKRLS
jgi:dGTPase